MLLIHIIMEMTLNSQNYYRSPINVFEILLSIILCCTSLSATYADKSYNHQTVASTPILASMTWSQDKGFDLVVDEITKTPETVGWVNFTNAINETGWSYLEVKTHESFQDKIQVHFDKSNVEFRLF